MRDWDVAAALLDAASRVQRRSTWVLLLGFIATAVAAVVAEAAWGPVAVLAPLLATLAGVIYVRRSARALRGAGMAMVWLGNHGLLDTEARPTDRAASLARASSTDPEPDAGSLAAAMATAAGAHATGEDRDALLGLACYYEARSMALEKGDWAHSLARATTLIDMTEIGHELDAASGWGRLPNRAWVLIFPLAFLGALLVLFAATAQAIRWLSQ